MMMILFVVGVGAILFFSSQYELPRSGESYQKGVRELQEGFIDQLYKKDGIERVKPVVVGGELEEILSELEKEKTSQVELGSPPLIEQEEVQNFLDKKAKGLLVSNLEREGGLARLYLRGVLTYSDAGIYEQELFEGLAEILVVQDLQDLVVYRNGRPELFNTPNDQSGICLPERDDLELLGDFAEETGIAVEEVKRFEIQNWFKRGLIVRVINDEEITYET